MYYLGLTGKWYHMKASLCLMMEGKRDIIIILWGWRVLQKTLTNCITKGWEIWSASSILRQRTNVVFWSTLILQTLGCDFFFFLSCIFGWDTNYWQFLFEIIFKTSDQPNSQKLISQRWGTFGQSVPVCSEQTTGRMESLNQDDTVSKAKPGEQLLHSHQTSVSLDF